MKEICICTTNLFIRKCIAESKGCRWYELTVFLCTMYSHGIHTAVEMHCWGCNQEWKISPEWDFLNEMPSLTQAVGLTLRAPKSVQMKYEGGSFYKLDLQSLLDLKVCSVLWRSTAICIFNPPLQPTWVLIGQTRECWLNIAHPYKVTSHRKVPVAILCSVIEKTVPPQKFQIYLGPPIDWLECILNIGIVQIFHCHKISQYCSAPSHQSSISLRKRLKHVTGDIAQAIHITQSPSVNIWSLKR